MYPESLHEQGLAELANTLGDRLKQTKAQLVAISKRLKVLEAERRDVARLSRAHEKKHKSLHDELYGRLKNIRAQCNGLYLQQQELQDSKSHDQSQLYMLNKKIHKQPVVAASPTPVPPKFNEKTKIQGVDPGVVTMASGVCTSQKPLFEYINRFQVLQDHQDTVKHEKDKNGALEMTVNIVNTAANTKSSPANSTKKKQKKRVKSKCRLRRFYGKHCSQHRRQMGSKSFITFTGSWYGVSNYIKGHIRRSTKPYYSRQDSHGQGTVIKTNEYASTVTCNSCYRRTKKQTQRLPSRKLVSIKGVVVCLNPNYPRRTINRDQNGARNIALIGFSKMVSHDGHTLPPFRSMYNPDKYYLSTNLRAYQHGDEFPSP